MRWDQRAEHCDRWDDPAANLYAQGYVRPRYDVTDIKQAPFNWNTLSPIIDVRPDRTPIHDAREFREQLALGRDSVSTSTFWSVYVQGGFQGDKGGDRDPDAESGGAAGETLGDDDSYGRFLYMETIRSAVPREPAEQQGRRRHAQSEQCSPEQRTRVGQGLAGVVHEGRDEEGERVQRAVYQHTGQQRSRPKAHHSEDAPHCESEEQPVEVEVHHGEEDGRSVERAQRPERALPGWQDDAAHQDLLEDGGGGGDGQDRHCGIEGVCGA